MSALAILFFAAAVVVAALAVLVFKDSPRLTPSQATWLVVPLLVAIASAAYYRSHHHASVAPVASEGQVATQSVDASAATQDSDSATSSQAGQAASAVASSAPAAQASKATSAMAAAPAGAASGPDGKALYASNCAACHQITGAGEPGAFPPLAGSEIPNGPAAKHIEIVLDGLSGPVKVQGKTYNGVMPPFKGQLKADAVAAIVTYERTAWGNHGGAVTPAQVKAAGG